MDTKPYNALTSAQRARDEALRRLKRVRGMTIVGAGALTAALAGLVSAVAPGRTLGARTKVAAAPRTARPAPRRSSTRALRMPPLASASQLGLQRPGAAPESAAPGGQGTAPSDQGTAPSDQGSTAPSQQAAPAPQPAPVAPAPQPAAPQPAPAGGGAVSGGS
jgi:hypothetical protein